MKLLRIIFILTIAIPFTGCGNTDNTESLEDSNSSDLISLSLTVVDAPLEGVSVKLNSFQRGLLSEGFSDFSGLTALKVSREVLSSINDEDIVFVTASASKNSKVHLEDSVNLLQPGQVMLKSFLPSTSVIKQAIVKDSHLDRTDEFKEHLVLSHLTTAESWLIEEALLSKNLISRIIEDDFAEISQFNSSELNLVSSLRDSIRSGLRGGSLNGDMALKYQLYALSVKAMVEDGVTGFLVNQSDTDFSKSGVVITNFIKNKQFSLNAKFESQMTSLKTRLNEDFNDSLLNSSISSVQMRERLVSEQLVNIKNAHKADISSEFTSIIDPLTKTVISQTEPKVTLQHILDDSIRGSNETSITADLLSGAAIIEVQIPCDEGRIRC